MIDPVEITRISYEDSRPKNESCCPPWEELDEDKKKGMIASTNRTLDALKQHGYYMVKIK